MSILAQVIDTFVSLFDAQKEPTNQPKLNP